VATLKALSVLINEDKPPFKSPVRPDDADDDGLDPLSPVKEDCLFSKID
jgi:hypothetical protein